MNLVERVRNILLSPKAEWSVIEAETGSTADLYKSYVMPLAAIGPVASIIGMSIIGIQASFIGTYRTPFWSAFAHGIISYAFALAGVLVLGLIVDALAPTFGGEKNAEQALKAAVYASTPGWVAGILLLVPVLGTLVWVIGLYSLYLFYLGLPVLMKAPQEKAVAYTATVVIAGLVVMLIIGGAGALFFPAPHVPAGLLAPQ